MIIVSEFHRIPLKVNYFNEMKKIVLQIVLGSIFLITVLACNNGGIYGEYKTIPRATWHSDSILVFQVPVIDTLLNHNLYINVRNDIEYKYSNLWLFIDIVQPGDSTAVTDTLELTLADPTGKWLGHGFGGVKTNETLFKKNVFFPVSGNYEIQIKQGMRGQQLDGITEVGVRVE
jgi:gliding motility-associated lipoprotein GldH